MQPRRERPWVREMVFQVTKRGDSVMVEERWEVRRGWRPRIRLAGVCWRGRVRGCLKLLEGLQIGMGNKYPTDRNEGSRG